MMEEESIRFTPRMSARVWVALFAAVTVIVSSFVITHAVTAEDEDAVRSAQTDEFTEQVDAVAANFESETEAIENAITAAMRDATTMQPGAKELLDLETAVVLSMTPPTLRLTTFGVAWASGDYTSIGTNGTSGRLARGVAIDGTLVFSAIDGGTPTEIPNFDVIDRAWYQAAVTMPDVFHWMGPSTSFSVPNMAVVAISEPASMMVFQAGVDVSRFEALARSTTSAAGLDAVLVVSDSMNDTEPVYTSVNGELSPSLLRTALDENHVDGSSPVLTDGDRVAKAVPLMPGSDDIQLVVSTTLTPEVAASTPPLVPTVALVIAFMVLAALATTWAMRRVGTGLSRQDDGRLVLERRRSPISEFDQINSEAVRWAKVINESIDAERSATSRLAALYDKFTTDSELRSQWLATQLHDGPTQEVAGARLRLETSDDPPAEVIESLRRAETEMRSLAFDLVPLDLVSNGIVGALNTLAAASSNESTEVVCRASDPGVIGRSTQRLLVRCAQELVNNALKHSHASRITLGLSRTETDVVLTCRDNGIGFVSNPDRSPTAGFGLMSIEVQVAHAGGKFTFDDSHTSPGVHATVTLPVQQLFDTEPATPSTWTPSTIAP